MFRAADRRLPHKVFYLLWFVFKYTMLFSCEECNGLRYHRGTHSVTDFFCDSCGAALFWQEAIVLELIISTFYLERALVFEAAERIAHHYILPAQTADSQIIALRQIASGIIGRQHQVRPGTTDQKRFIHMS
jgi:hypothetical protein